MLSDTMKKFYNQRKKSNKFNNKEKMMHHTLIKHFDIIKVLLRNFKCICRIPIHWLILYFMLSSLPLQAIYSNINVQTGGNILFDQMDKLCCNKSHINIAIL